MCECGSVFVQFLQACRSPSLEAGLVTGLPYTWRQRLVGLSVSGGLVQMIQPGGRLGYSPAAFGTFRTLGGGAWWA